MIKAVIFDMDGTVIDSIKAHSHATTWVIDLISKDLGYKKPSGYENFVAEYFGLDYRTIIKNYVFPAISDKDNRKYEKKRNRYLLKHNMSYIKRFKGANSLFKFLRNNKIKIAIASSSSKKEIGAFAKKVLLLKYVNKIVGREEVEHAKPDPEMILLACRKLKTSIKNVVYVGDSKYDAISCSRIKVPFMGVATGQLNIKQLKRYTKNSFNDLFEVKKYLDSKI